MFRRIALVSGFLFGVGLALSGMTGTAKVLGFLDVFGQWDITLLLVMGAALSVTIPGFYIVTRRAAPCFADEFDLPVNRNIDKNLLIGAVIFGVGWGIYGYCPGPALAALVYGNLNTLLFVVAMLIGMQIHKVSSSNT